jgi:hypothetical protein
MGKRRLRTIYVRIAYLTIATAALVNGGCLLVAAGAAAGGAGYAGYAFVKGKVCQTYKANCADSWAALHTALRELGMPVVSEEYQPNGESSLESRTPDGEVVHIFVESCPNPNPAENPLCRICVRVATFGDQFVSDRILSQVDTHLVAFPPPAAPAAPATPALGAPQPIQTPPQTAPPPLLAPEPEPVAGRQGK